MHLRWQLPRCTKQRKMSRCYLPNSETLLMIEAKSLKTLNWVSVCGCGKGPGPVSNLFSWMSIPALWPLDNLKHTWSVLLDLITTVPRLWGVKPKRFTLIFLLPGDFRLAVSKKAKYRSEPTIWWEVSPPGESCQLRFQPFKCQMLLILSLALLSVCSPSFLF